MLFVTACHKSCLAPVSRSDAEPRDPVHVEAALRAVEDEVLELAFEVGLHPQELEAEHLRVDGDRVIASTSSLRFVDEFIRLDGLLGDGPDGVLKDLAFSACHGRDARASRRSCCSTCTRLAPKDQ